MVLIKNLPNMSDTVILVELRDAWKEMEVNIRHDVAPGGRLSDYIVALEREAKRRKLSFQHPPAKMLKGWAKDRNSMTVPGRE